MYFVKLFFIYAIGGFLLETLYSLVFNLNYDSGFLNGPWTPIYGIGAVVIILISDYLFKHLHLKRWQESIFVFLIIMLVLTILEFIGGYLIEIIFNVKFWSYDHYMFNIGDYISLELSFIWGIFSLLLIYCIHPYIRKRIKYFPNILLLLIIIFFIYDVIFTLINGLN